MDFGDDDDWNFSAEELDSLERDAFQKLSQQRINSASTCSCSSSFSFNHHHHPHQSSLPTTTTTSNAFESFIPISLPNQVPPPPPPLSPGARVLPSSLDVKVNPVERKLTVKFFLHATGNIAAKFSYDQALVAAFRKIPKAAWNAKERLWMFPVSSLSLAEKVLHEVSGVNVEIENLDPLVHRAIAAVSVVPDIRDLYDRIPSFIESKLLGFQREGVRFILQHGGRAFLADEMGLGKTLQAIAVASCIRDSWPVLILTPSSLRLQWASMIQQWMNIPPSDILVVLSQCGGSNRAGYTLVSSSSKGTIHLDGLFNIISYDTVPKLQNLLMASDFKIVIADESHFLKNAQAKRTTASLPVIKKAQYAILLSGTPALSRPIELFTQLEALYPDVYKNVHEYGKRYCKGGTFGMYQGASNHEELHNLLKATVMIRRLKNDVLSELPVKRRQQKEPNFEVGEMYAAEASMAATSFLRNPVRIRPTTSHNILITKSLPWNQKCQCSSTSSSNVSVDEDKSVFSVTPATKYDVDYLGEKTKGDLNVKLESLEAFGIDGQATLEGPIEEVARMEAEEAEGLLKDLGIPSPFLSRHSPRGIFCSRTLNLRSISAIGYDMDYTLMHYNVIAWEGRAYDYCMENLRKVGFPVDGLAFDPDLVIRGLVIDKEKGNLVKADRFGYVKRAMHGTTMLSNRAVREMYGRELVDLRKESRWEFLNTLFSVSEAVAYMQMVDRLDDGTIAAQLGPLDYKGLYKAVGRALFRAHVEGQLKSEIMSKPELFVTPDPELPLALLDQKEAGKKLLLITNSDYHYTDTMMQHSFNRFLPNNMGWRDLFDIVIVSARKPEFFQMSHPMYEVVTGEGLMRPCFKAVTGGLYSGGSAQMVENSLDIHGDEILYVGDHIYTDVSQSKVHLRWRTALICRELEEEYSALIGSRGHRESLIELTNQKEIVGDLFNQLRLASQRRTKGRPAQTLAATNLADQELSDSMQKLLIVMQRLDQKIALLLESDGELFNKRWGFLSRAGFWDKSHLMRQIEKYADIYTSRVSNFLHYTPFMYFRSQEQTLAHDSYSYYCSKIYGSAADNEVNSMS